MVHQRMYLISHQTYIGIKAACLAVGIVKIRNDRLLQRQRMLYPQTLVVHCLGINTM